MISIIFEREILKAVTDDNIDSPASKIRVNAFNKSSYLLTEHSDVEVIIEGILYDQIKVRLNDDHQRFFESIYEIDRSASGLTNKYDTTSAIKFITEKRKLIFPKRKVIIVTENTSNYDNCPKNHRLKIITPKEFVEKVNMYNEIKETEENPYTAMVTSIFY